MRRALVVVAASLSLSSCAPTERGGEPIHRGAPVSVAPAATMRDAIEQSARQFDVPRDVLLAVSWAEGRWIDPGIPGPEAGEPGEVHAALEVGPLHLRGGVSLDTLARAQALLGVDEAALRGSLALQVAGAAAVLAELGRATGARPDAVDTWAEAVARYSGLAGREAQVGYAAAVWEVLRQGRREATFTGETLAVAGRNGPAIEDLLGVERVAQHSDDYPPARWVPAHSGNHGGNRGGPPLGITIHDTEGSYAGTISWFQNPASGVATHYVIRSSDGEVTQMLRDTTIAWHCANTHWNTHAIGIEHEGFYTAPERWYTEAMYVASARLVRHLCDRYSIPIDRAHIFGHYQVFRSGGSAICAGSWDSCRTMTRNHVDPGPGWNWDHYLDLVRGSGGMVRPMYDAALVAVNYPRTMAPGERAVAYVEYRNTGTATWDATTTRLGTTQPRDHDGRLYDTVNWLNRTRPTAVDRATAPGATGRFSFIVQAPMATAPTTVTESFGLVQEGTAWFGPPDDAVTLTITVAPGGGDGGGVDPDAAVDEDAGGVSDAASAPEDSGSVAPPRDSGSASDALVRDAGARDSGGGSEMSGGCGCRAAGGARNGRAGGVLLALGAAVAAMARRRRA